MIKHTYNTPNVLAVIPARGGSKGIPRKNTQLLGNKPLVAYSIEVARATPNINRVVVSTDDEEIAQIARDYGAEVPFLRPREISSDTAEIAQALAHVRSELMKQEGFMADIQVCMYPTHPFRKVSMVKSLVDILIDGCGLVTTVKEVTAGRGGFFVKKDGLLQPLTDRGRSAAEGRYLRTYGCFQGSNLRFCPGRYSHVLRNDIELIDIDTWDDLALANGVIDHNLFEFGI